MRFHGPVVGFEAEKYLSPKELRKMDPFMHYGYGAAADAIKDSGIEVTPANAHRIGITMGAGIGGLTVVRQVHRVLPAEGIVYLGDTARVPYGTKSPGTVVRFACEDTERLFRLERVRSIPPDIQRTALRKLAQLHAVTKLSQLRAPPGNRLEALKGDRKGQHSIRINDQWRICFCWESDGPHDVAIVDYH